MVVWSRTVPGEVGGVRASDGLGLTGGGGVNTNSKVFGLTSWMDSWPLLTRGKRCDEQLGGKDQ